MDESRILIVDPDRRYVSDRASSEVGSSAIREPTMNVSTDLLEFIQIRSDHRLIPRLF